ncbi:TVP38/TMEM64 family protein [Microcoleus sp. FACHB-68]|uniref:TVP38/TMEM64 family protein n=1 Tax=Microcoleus sp. FACHB-68 TaxID=2692826 RepID=UPI0016829FF3|nr:TVP38/TMEM64 family protein [Microcoleus sp. FACHB-68]MBD1936308.1 TVP38/TMEM64 family protein [Microcoleus sp. FACHB-68]
MLGKAIKNPRIWLGIALAICLLLCALGPLQALFNYSFLVKQLESRGNLAVCLFVGVFALATVVGIPGVIFPVVAGAVFGLFWGTFWSVVGATLGAVGAFWMSRYLLRGWAERRFADGGVLHQLNVAITGNPFAFVVAVRFAPISPFTVVNFLFGLTPINWIPYSAGTFIGIIPGTVAYTWVGVTGNQVLQTGDRLPFILALSLLTLLSLLPVLARKKGFSSAK